MILAPRRVRAAVTAPPPEPPPEPPPPVAGHVGPAELPRVVPQYTPSNMPTAGTWHAPMTAAALQALLAGSSVQPGDTIFLQRGVIYNSPSIPKQVFPVIPGAETNPIRVITSDTGAIPMPGQRITPASRATVPHFRCQQINVECVLVRGSGWHFVGIEADAGNVTSIFGVVRLGLVGESSYIPSVSYSRGAYIGGWLSLQDNNLGNPQVEGPWWRRATVADLPTNVVLDRCDIAARQYSNGCAVVLFCNTRTVVICDSWLWGEGKAAFEDKAFLGTEFAGPMLFRNNTCVSASIPFLTGGADTDIDVIPEDLTIERNYFGRPLRFLPFRPEWDGNNRQHKNCFEFKCARRADVRDNLFANHFDGGQSQFFAIVLKVANRVAGLNNSRTEDITVRFNRLRNIGGGFSLGADDASTPSAGVGRFSIYQNYTETPLGAFNTGNQRSWGFNVVGNGLFRDAHLERNTLASRHPSDDTADSAIVNSTNTQIPGFVARGNILEHGEFGIFGDGGAFPGIGQFGGAGSSASANFLLSDVPRSSVQYPAGQLTVVTDAAGLYVNRAGGNYRPAAAVRGQGHEGADPGADIDAVNARTAGCETGVWT